MAEAMIKGIISSSLAKPDNISVSDIDESRCRYLTNQYRVFATTINSTVLEGTDMLVLAVKPQNLQSVASEIRDLLNPNKLVISILAGTRMETLTDSLNHQSVIRVMPNTPAQVGAGVSLWLCSSNINPKDASIVQSILQTFGQELRVEDEQYIDMATALSASGPAYVLSFLESMVDAGVHIGLPRETARFLTIQTVLGSCALVEQTGQHFAELRDMVTSPGGTTAEALLALEQGKFRSTIINAVIAAYQKSITLGGKQS